MNNTETVQLGDRLFPVVPQKHAKLRKHLSGEMLQKVMTRDYAAESYKLLCILIPAVKPENGGMPEWEFEGFNSQEAWDRWKAGDEDAYDEERDPSPTTAQIVEALEKALMVGGAARLGKLTSLIDLAGRASLAQQTPTPLASPGANGASTSTPTGTSQTT